MDLDPVVSGMLRYRDGKACEHVNYYCTLRPISITFRTDLEFVVFKGKHALNPTLFRVRVADIVDVCYWDDSGAKHFGSDGKVVEDVVPMGFVSGMNLVGYAVSKNASEFVIATNRGEKVHLIADSDDKAADWIANIRGAVEDHFENWGMPFTVGPQDGVTLRTISQLKEIEKNRGLDMGGCIKTFDMTRVLGNGAPLLNPSNEGDAELLVLAQSPEKHDPYLASTKVISVVDAAMVEPDWVEIETERDLGILTNASAFSTVEDEWISLSSNESNEEEEVEATGVETGATLKAVATGPTHRRFIPGKEQLLEVQDLASSATCVPIPAGLNSGEEQLLEVQNLIMRGYLLLEEGDPGQAGRIFKNAKDTAKTLRNPYLEAKASAGLASAYRDQPNMQRAAGPLFEVAAHSFELTGDSGNRLTCLQDAVDVYVQVGNKTDALRLMETYDNRRKPGTAPVFEQRIRELKALLE